MVSYQLTCNTNRFSITQLRIHHKVLAKFTCLNIFKNRQVVMNLMKACRRAKDTTIERIATVGATTILLRLIDNQPQSGSFWNTFWQVSKVVIKNDKQALPDLIKALRCWLGI